MPRPNSQAPNKRKLIDLFVTSAKPAERAHYLVWDTYQRGLALSVQATGSKAYKTIYRHGGRPRWYHIGHAVAISLANARQIAGEIMFRVAKGEDPQANRRAERGAGTFEELATRYVNEYAQKENKSWKQADAIVRKHLLPRWGKLLAASISRADVRALFASIEAPVLANQVRASASAMFSWAIREEVGGVKINPCFGVTPNETQDRERVLSDSEVRSFWRELSPALKLILLTGQRPGEVLNMRREHIRDGRWEMPGDPVPALKWPGTKNGQNHRVWLPKPELALVEQVLAGDPNRKLSKRMRRICAKLGVERATPHDLRRTHGTTITRLGFGRDAMNRIQNHIEGGIADVYDQHQYAAENRRIMEAVARHILKLAEGAKNIETQDLQTEQA
jgi:integrase